MKKLILIFFTTFSVLSYSQNCNIGNEDSTGFNFQDPFWPGFLLGVKFNLNTDGTLHSLNLLGRNTGSQVQMAVYEDNNGVPGNLIITSNIGIVGNGAISLPVSPTPLLSGDYWIFAVYDIVGVHTYATISDLGNIAYYQSLNFGNSLPTNASNFSSQMDTDYTYFLEISCGIVGTSEFLLYNSQKILSKVTDILGREANEKQNTPLFYIYNDGTVEKKIIVE